MLSPLAVRVPWQGPDIGPLDRIKIRSDGGGLGAAWHLAHVDVLSSATGESYHFPFSNWCACTTTRTRRTPRWARKLRR